MGLSETRKTQEIQAAENENRKFVVSSKQRNKGITVCKIQHLCVASFFVWKISAGLELEQKSRQCMSPFQKVKFTDASIHIYFSFYSWNSEVTTFL